MKGQDILLLFKLISLEKSDLKGNTTNNSSWQDWELEDSHFPDDESQIGIFQTGQDVGRSEEAIRISRYSIRSLANATGISKSQVALSLSRCYEIGLAEATRISGIPRVHSTALGEFVIYVFPPKRGPLTRGIATGWGAPALQGSISSAGETPLVWPDARGNTKGMTLEPIYHSVPYAVKKDVDLYKFLALTDSIRLGLARERTIASELLMNMLLEVRNEYTRHS